MFDESALRFLRDLEANNDREWFQPRKEEYERVVRAPMADLVTAVNKELAKTAPDYINEPSKAIYRIYRDTRFSKDKTPYKTHIGALFPHRRLGKDGGAALYFHLAANEFLIAGGLYKTPPPILLAVRWHLAESHPRLTSILKRKAVREYFGNLQGDRLARPPKGFRDDHAAIEYLKQKDLLLEVSRPPEEALGPDAVKQLVRGMKLLAPFVEYLNEPLLRKATPDPMFL